MARPLIELNMAEMVRIANLVNDTVCGPLAEQVAGRARANAPVESGAYQSSIGIQKDERSGEGDWAHTYVEATDAKAHAIESRTGNLARALTGTSRSKAQVASRKERRADQKAYRESRKRT